MKNATYVVFVFTTPSVRGQRTHTNAGTQLRFINQVNIIHLR